MNMMKLGIAAAVGGMLATSGISSLAASAHSETSEVTDTINELRLREEAYLMEHGTYLSTAADETTMFPESPSLQAREIGELPATWTKLDVRLSSTLRSCSYVVITGEGTATTAGFTATTVFKLSRPERSWYYVIARCNPSSTSSGLYFASSVEPAIQQFAAQAQPGR